MIQLEIVAIRKTWISSFLPRSGLLISRRKKVKFRGIFSDKFAEKSADFRIIFLANVVEKQSVKKADFVVILRQISLEIKNLIFALIRPVFLTFF